MVEHVVKVCDKVIGFNKRKFVNIMSESRDVRKGRKIANKCEHILSEDFYLLPSSRRFRVPKTRTMRRLKAETHMKNVKITRKYFEVMLCTYSYEDLQSSVSFEHQKI